MNVYALVRTISEYDGYPILRGVFASADEAKSARTQWLSELGEHDPFAEQTYRPTFDFASDTQVLKISYNGAKSPSVFLLVQRSEAFGQSRVRIVGAHASEQSATEAASHLEEHEDFPNWIDIVHVECGVLSDDGGYLNAS